MTILYVIIVDNKVCRKAKRGGACIVKVEVEDSLFGERASTFLCINITLVLLHLRFKLSRIFLVFEQWKSKHFVSGMFFKCCTSLASKPDHPSSLSRLIWCPLQAVAMFIGTMVQQLTLLWFNNKCWICFSYVCVVIMEWNFVKSSLFSGQIFLKGFLMQL